jgi:hypothetical protein
MTYEYNPVDNWDELNIALRDIEFATEGLITLVPLISSAQLEDIAHSVNVGVSKVLGYAVKNSSTGALVFASGNTPGSVWHYYNGAIAHTPV